MVQAGNYRVVYRVVTQWEKAGGPHRLESA